jgi:hypothetical protein
MCVAKVGPDGSYEKTEDHVWRGTPRPTGHILVKT